MFFTILVRILLFLGVAFLATILVKVAFLALKSVLLKIRDKIRLKAGRRIFMGSVGKLAAEVAKEAERTGNIHDVNALLDELGDEGVVLASVDANNEVNQDEIEIMSAEQIDAKLDTLLSKNNGELIFA